MLVGIRSERLLSGALSPSLASALTPKQGLLSGIGGRNYPAPFPVTRLMPYIFKPPTFDVSCDPDFEHFDDYFHRHTRKRGYSVLVTGSTVSTYPGINAPTTDEIVAADYHYQGGKKHTISDAEYTTLTTADASWAAHCTAI